ncbi:MAG TPA: sugar ABC transporter substrate-binding protein [Streptosporangiaceae bacterium]|nr:sugar ABC transporter substrate-binding protein [Streptosporangiaceae bacterium]
MRKTRWWRAAGATAVAMGVLAAAACSSGGSGSGSSSSSSGKQTLQMWARADDAAFLPTLVKAFNNSHPNIKIQLTLVPDAQVVQKYSQAASGGSGPDLVSTEIGTMATFTPTGWYQDITSTVDGLSYKKDLSPAHLGQATYNGKIYGMPFTADVSVLYYNKTLFTKAGLNPNDPPKTWAQIETDATTIRSKLGGSYYGYFFSGACAGCMAFTMLPYMWADGGNILKQTSAVGTPTLSPNPALEKTLAFYRSMWKSGAVAPTAKTENGTNQFGAFYSGKIGMFVQGTYPFSVLKNQYKNVDFGIELIPSTDGGTNASYAGGDNLSITKNAKPGAKTALLWFESTGEKMLASQGVLPTRSDIADATYAKQDPRQAVFVQALAVGRTPKSTKASPVLFDNTGPFNSLIQNAIFGTGSVTSAMSSAQPSASSLMGGQ